MAKKKKTDGPFVWFLNSFELQNHPPSPLSRSEKLSDKAHIRELVKAIVRKPDFARPSPPLS